MMKFLINGSHQIKYDLGKEQYLTWMKSLTLFDDPKDIVKQKSVKEYLQSCPQNNKKYNLVIVQFVVTKGNNQKCSSFIIERITDWTSEVEE